MCNASEVVFCMILHLSVGIQGGYVDLSQKMNFEIFSKICYILM